MELLPRGQFNFMLDHFVSMSSMIFLRVDHLFLAFAFFFSLPPTNEQEVIAAVPPHWHEGVTEDHGSRFSGAVSAHTFPVHSPQSKIIISISLVGHFRFSPCVFLSLLVPIFR